MPYMAVVSHVQSAVSVYIPDESLHHIVPQGRFSYDIQEGLPIDTRGISPLQNLMLDVLAAIELQQSVQPVGNP
jgi:hypothetical protein